MADEIKQVVALLRDYAIQYGLRIIIALILFFVGFKLVDVISNKLVTKNKLKKLDEAAASFVRSIIKVLAKILIAVSCIAIVGIPIASVITVLGAFGVAVSLAVQGTLSNIAGGFMIIFNKPFKIGDLISNSGVTGVVTSIDLFYTTLVTLDNKKLMLPNNQVIGSEIENATAFAERRTDIEFTASYSDDIDEVKKAIFDVLMKNEKIIKVDGATVKAPVVYVNAHADSAVVYLARYWTKTSEVFPTKFEVIEDVKKEFDARNIEIPFPQVDVHNK